MKDKIAIIKFSGGIGNQMFQYQFMNWLRHKKNFIVYADFNFGYNNKPSHYGFEINRVFDVNLKTNYFISIYSKSIHGHKLNLFEIVLYKILPKIKHVKCHNLIFKDFDSSRNFISYFDGYWQSYKYSTIELDYTNLFLSKYYNYIIKNEFLHKITSYNNSVSLHIRGGDYLNDKNTHKILGEVVNVSYYTKAVEKLIKCLDNPYFFVFTDDILYAEQILKHCTFNYTIVDNLVDRDNYFLNIYLMAKCKNNIISNSTFALWGALLNNNKDKIVIAPNRWINSIESEINDILPVDFLKL